jgi:hypothetical protein
LGGWVLESDLIVWRNITFKGGNWYQTWNNIIYLKREDACVYKAGHGHHMQSLYPDPGQGFFSFSFWNKMKKYKIRKEIKKKRFSSHDQCGSRAIYL